MLLFRVFTILVLLAGRQTWRINRPIVFGEDCRLGEFPFMASLRLTFYKNAHSCGCSVLTPSWLLTAAHCVYESNPEEFSVRYEFLKMSEPDPKIVKVVEIVIHHEYSPIYLNNDIALLRVEPELEMSKCVQTIKLPDEYSRIEHETPATVIGWGLDENGELPDTLQKVGILVASKSKCKELFGNYFYLTNLCAGTEDAGKDSCQGDSGGPLVVNDVQVGIVSWGFEKCGASPFSGIYTDVSFYIDWISDALEARQNEEDEYEFEEQYNFDGYL